MPRSRKVPLPIMPGVILSQTDYEAQGRYTDADHVRFVDGQPEKIGGWEQWNNPGEELSGVCRSMRCWQDFSYNVWNAFGTSDRLWLYDPNKKRTNITPFIETGTLTNPFSVINGSGVVTVRDPAHSLQIGQYVNFSTASAVGGIIVSGEYKVASILDADLYTILHPSPATSTAGPGGGSVDFSYEIPPGNVDVFRGGGWGIGRYGTGTYGTVRDSVTFLQFSRYWSLDGYGQNLLALPSGGRLYRWQNVETARAAVVPNSPAKGLYMFVTSERIVVILGAGDDFMTMQWCDDDDITLWAPAPDNTANIRRLQEGSRLIAGVRLAQAVNVVWTDTALYLMQFTGNNNVYSTRVVGTNCGLISPAAFVEVDGIAYWMSPTTFHMYGGQLSEMPRADEIKSVLGQIDSLQRFKIHCHFNPLFREIWWFYPSQGSAECDRYVMVNLDTWDWTPGTLDRTAFGICSLVQEYSLFATDQNGTIYQHETGADADGLPLNWHLESGFFDIESGNAGLNIDGYIPDFAEQSGAIDVTLTSRDLPEDTTVLDTETKEILAGDAIADFRHFGRQSKLRLSQTDVLGGRFRLGRHRLEISGTPSKRHD